MNHANILLDWRTIELELRTKDELKFFARNIVK